MEGFIGFITILVIVGVIYSIPYSVKKGIQRDAEYLENIKKSILKKSIPIINKNKQQLAIQRKKSSFTDVYGKENLTKWYDKEIPYFIEQHIYPKLNKEELIIDLPNFVELVKKIDTTAKRIKINKAGYSNKMNGFEFEDFCANKLKTEGWKVSKTKGGADQGVDLIIKKGKRNIAVQCKKYARPIGNKAVQEVKAGIDYYHLNEGIVLANNTFTKSAIELANSNNIKLIHYLETKNI